MNGIRFLVDALSNPAVLAGAVLIVFFVLASTRSAKWLRATTRTVMQPLTNIDSRGSRLRVAIGAGVASSRWRYTSGPGVGNRYFDLDRSITSPGNALEIAESLRGHVERLGEPIDYVAVIERDAGPVGALSLFPLLSETLGVETIIVRPRRRINWAALKFPGAASDLAGGNVALVTDTVTTGEAVLAAVNHLERYGLRIQCIFPILDRTDDPNSPSVGIRRLTDSGYRVIALASYRDLGLVGTRTSAAA